MVTTQKNKGSSSPLAGAKLEIIYYTDPLCCWSWAFEPQWRRLLYEFDGQINYRYCMGGLLPGWKNYNDSINAVSKPIQMGPVWMHAGQLSGMPLNHNIWMVDPPASSYPACMAVKCAGLQSVEAAENYLRLAREAVMIHGENISKQEVLLRLAKQLKSMLTRFNYSLFKKDLTGDRGIEAFRSDLQEAQYHNINRFPSLVVKNKRNEAVLISGYRPYHLVLAAIQPLASLDKTNDIADEEACKNYWSSITNRELEEITKR